MAMLRFEEFTPVIPREYRTRGTSYDDNIYCFDIETTSLFWTEETQAWLPWESSFKESKGRILKHGTPYIWMFGQNDQVYYGRDMVEEFPRILKMLSDDTVRKTIWVHNLSWETQFLRDIFVNEHWTISQMVATAPRKPIRFLIEDLNIEFRCSFKLTALSLANCVPAFGIDIEKKVGDLDYSAPRGIETPLTDKEMGYCEYDIRVLERVIRKEYLDQYKHIKLIPLTSTGEVRNAYRKVLPKEHIFKCRWDVPTLRAYKFMRAALMGGYCHGNVLYNGITQFNLLAYDISSSYPHQCLKKYPYRLSYHWGKPFKKYEDRENYAIIYHIRLHDVELTRVMSFISVSKCVSISIPYKSDNGRLVSAKQVELYLTEIDFDLFNKFYTYSKIEYIDYYVGKKRYLPKYFIQFWLEQYGTKTRLKGVKATPERDYPTEYRRGKGRCNSMYGVMLTNILNSTIELNGSDEWCCPVITDEAAESMLNDLREGWRTIFWYVHGCWITAYARKQLMEDAILPFDKYLVYSDTDSAKIQSTAPGVREHFEKVNQRIMEEDKKAILDIGLDPELLTPKDVNGEEHPLGVWDLEAEYAEMKALKAKAYCFREMGEKQIHVCVSGVGTKHSSELITSMDRFNSQTIFNEYYAGKLEHTYIDDQHNIYFRDYLGEWQQSTQSHGITLNPAEYHMSGPCVDEVILQNVQRKMHEHILTDGHFV